MTLTAPEGPETLEKRETKVRAVWIAFASRIIAQILGAVATIGLGVLFLHQYQSDTRVALDAANADRPIARATTGTSSQQAIAVLPLANFSTDSRDRFLADAITDAVVAELAQLEGQPVISRTSAMRYKTESKTIPQIGRELGVDLIIEGSIVKSGTGVRVIVQLIDARTDEHVWAHGYDRHADDILVLQREMATAIARDVKSALSLHRAAPTREANPPAVALQP